MATTYNDNGGSVNGSNKNFTFTFPYLKTQDVKVSLNGLTQATTKYTVNVGVNPTRIEFNNNSVDSTVQESSGAPKTGVTVRVYRDTDVDSAKAVYAAGSSIRAQNLNDNQDQVLYALQEEQNQPESLTDADINPAAEIQVSKLKNGTTARQVLQTASNGTDVEWTSNVDLPGTLDVSSNAQFDGNVDVTGTTTVGGTVNSAAIVTGAITGSNNLNVKNGTGGATKFFVTAASGNTEISGNTDIDGTLTVGGTSNSAAVVTGAITGSNNLLVKNGNGGATKFFVQASNGNTTVHGNLDVAGTFEVTGTSQYTGQQTVPGGALVKNIEVGLDADNEVSTTSGNLVLDSAAGTVQITDHLNVTGNADVDSNLNVDGTSTLTGNTTIGGTLTVTGTTNLAANSIGTTEIAGSAITSAKIADNQIDSEHYKDLSIDAEHVASNAITAGKLATDAVETVKIKDHNVTTAKIADEAVTTGKIENDAVTIDKISDNVIVTETEQAAHSVDNNHFFTTAAAEARFFNASTGETIKDGQSFPDNDTTIATTAAINDRIIDLVDDVGGFVPIANETSFPNANPDVNNGTGTLVSIKALSSNLTSNGSGVATITNGTVGNSTVTINGLANSTTYNAGYGLIVETTSTLNTYSFHRQVPKATEVTTVAGSISNVNTVAGSISNVNAVAGNATNINAVAADATDIGTVAGKATEIGRLGTADAVSDMNTLGTTAIVSDMDTLADISSNITTVAGISANVTSVAGNASNINSAVSNASNINSAVSNASNINSAVSNASNINTVAGISSNVTTVAGISSNVTTVAGNNANVTTVASNMGTVNDFAARYRTGANNPTTSLDVGDLFFNTSANELKVYNGSAWQGGVTATGNFASVTGNTFTGDNLYNDNIKLKLGTGSDFQIYHNGSNRNLIESHGGHEIHINKDTSESCAKFKPDGAVELFYDNAKKFETASDGCKSIIAGTNSFRIGSTDASGVVLVLDGDSNGDGAGSDYCSIEHGTDGDLSIHADNPSGDAQFELYVGSGSTTAIIAEAAGEVQLFHNGTKKFVTGSYGFGTDENIRLLADNGSIQFGAGQDFKLWHDGTDDVIHSTGTSLRTRSNIFRANNAANNEVLFRAFSDGAFEAYYDGSKKLETTSTGVTVTGNVNLAADNNSFTVGAGSDLQIYHDGTNNILRNVGTRLDVIVNSSETAAKFNPNGAVELYYDDSKKLDTLAGGVQVHGNLYQHDNAKAVYGTGDDFKIYHDGSNTYFDHLGTGSLVHRIQNGDIYFQYYDGSSAEDMAVFRRNGAAELFYDNSKKLNTASGGVTVTGQLWASADVMVPDSAKLKAGDGEDLQLYHDGTQSIINDTANKLQIRSDLIQLMTAAGKNEYYLIGTEDGAVELYYDNTKRFETVSDGIRWTGHCYANDNYKLRLGDSEDLQIYHDGSNSYIRDEGTGHLLIDTNGSALLLRTTSGEVMVGCYPNAAAELLYDNSKKLHTFSGGVKFFGTLEADDSDKIKLGDSADLQIYHDGSSSYLHNNTGRLRFETDNVGFGFFKGAGSEYLALFNVDAECSLYYDNSKKLETTSSGVNITGGLNLTDHLTLDDTDKIKLGDGDDLQIYHDGSNSFIKNSTNAFRFLASDWGVNDVNNGEELLGATLNGAVKLYYDNSKKFETVSGGAKVTGTLETTDTISTVGNLDMADSTSTGNNRIRLGTGDDLEIYHDGSNSYIKNSTNDLFIQNATSDWIYIQPKAGEHCLIAKADGGVELYYDGVRKFYTDSDGVVVQGNLYLTTADNHKLYLGDGSDLEIWHSGSHNYIKGATSGQNLYIQNTNGSINIEAKINESSIWCGADSDVELYYDGTKKFETRSTGLKMWGDGGGDGIFEHDNTTGNNDRYLEIRNARSGNGRGRTAGIWIGENSNSQGDLYCRSSGGNSDISGGVRISNGSTSWSTVSDMRLKDKTGDITNALVDIAKIEPIKFTWKADANKTPQVGVSAQSVENVVPEAISKNVELDLQKQGDNTEYMGVRYTELVPLCIAALKEAKIKIETLETKVAALESS